MKTIIYIIVMTLSVSTLLNAQTITGKIVDGSTLSASGDLTDLPGISNIFVSIRGIELGAYTNEYGYFSVEAPAKGTYHLDISHISYETESLQVVVGENGFEFSNSIIVMPKVNAIDGDVVVTAQRTTKSSFKLTESISTLTAGQIRQNGSRSMAEALIGTTGVWMQKTNHGGGSPFVRGLTGNQTLLLLDGIRLNNSTYRYGPNQYFNTIDVLNVAQVEVLRGSGSVLYGSDALGGVIQVLTPNPTFSSDEMQVGGSIIGRVISNDMELGGRGVVELSTKKMALRGGVSLRSFGDLVAGGDLGTLAPSSYDERAADFKGLFKVGGKGLLTLSYNGIFQSEVGRYDQVAQRGYMLYQFNPQDRQMAYVRFNLDGNSAIFDNLRVTVSYQNSLEGREKRRVDSSTFTFEEDEVNTIGMIAELKSTLGELSSFITGVEVYADKVNSQTIDTDIDTGDETIRRGLYPDDARATNMAIFTSYNYQDEQLSFQLGLRYNTFNLKVRDPSFTDFDLTPSAFVGNISVRYALNETNALFGSFNTAFRAPNVNDLSSFGSFDFGIEIPNRELSPERAATSELGYKMKTDDLIFNFTLYNTHLTNLISRIRAQGWTSPTGEDIYTKENVAEASIRGVETDINYFFSPQFSVLGGLTYTYGQNTSKDEPMRRIPPLNGRLALNYVNPSGLTTQLEWVYAGRQDRLSGGDISDHRIDSNGTPAWNVINLKIGYQWEDFVINAGLANITDEAYRIHGSGVDGVGFNAWVSGMLRF
ncbi:MAG: TonB-dependent receptor [Bacteroidota bacterium]